MTNPFIGFENQHIITLNTKGGIATGWSFKHSDTNPGFFTPFGQELGSSYGKKTAGLKEAALTAGLLPALKLQQALANAFMSCAAPFVVIALCIQGEWNNAAHMGLGALVGPLLAIYFTGAFLLNLVKEVTALITRSLATLVSVCMGSANNPQSIGQKYPKATDLPEEYPETGFGYSV